MHKVQIETATVQGRQAPALVVRRSRLKILWVLLGSSLVTLPVWSDTEITSTRANRTDFASRRLHSFGVPFKRHHLLGLVATLTPTHRSKLGNILPATP